MFTDERLRLRVYERCSSPPRDARTRPRFASNTTFYVERHGSAPVAPEVLKTMRPQLSTPNWAELDRTHGLTSITTHATCSDSTGTVSIPCIKVALYSTALDVSGVAAILAQAYAAAGDACLVVEVTNGVRRARMQ